MLSFYHMEAFDLANSLSILQLTIEEEDDIIFQKENWGSTLQRVSMLK